MIGLLPAQIRAARAMLNWSMADLAKASMVSISTIKRLEQAQPHLVRDSTLVAIQNALETAGIVFLESDGIGPGLRLRSVKA